MREPGVDAALFNPFDSMDPADKLTSMYDAYMNPSVFSRFPWMVAIIAGSYLWFVKIYGPKYMEKRKPMKIKLILRIFNIVQVIANMYILVKFISNSMVRNFFWNHACRSPPEELIPVINDFMRITYFALWLKHLDLMDTVFMVVRKKYKQVTFLHVFHHVFVLTAGYIAWLERERQMIPIFILNNGIHVIMYVYYFLASYPYLKGILWWKPYLTKLQIVQFLLILLYMFMIWTNECDMSSTKGFLYLWLPYFMVLTYLFSKFYIDTYTSKGKEKQQK